MSGRHAVRTAARPSKHPKFGMHNSFRDAAGVASFHSPREANSRTYTGSAAERIKDGVAMGRLASGPYPRS